jgi:hypothetical protein
MPIVNFQLNLLARLIYSFTFLHYTFYSFEIIEIFLGAIKNFYTFVVGYD